MKMNLRRILTSFLVPLSSFLYAEAPRVVPEILDSIPHERSHFTQGLFFDGNDLIETTGLYGKSGLYRRTLDGKIIDSTKLSERYFGEVVSYSRAFTSSKSRVSSYRFFSALLISEAVLYKDFRLV